MNPIDNLIKSLIQTPLTPDALKDAKRDFSKLHKLTTIPSNMDLIKSYRDLLSSHQIKENPTLEKLIRKRGVRSESGIVSVQVLTKPFRCPGKCIFCPNDFTMPKSYINTEPGAQRALLNGFDPIRQVFNRLLSLTLTGHKTDKIELIVLGGTRDVYPTDYKEAFIKGLYDACNTFDTLWAKVKDDPVLLKAGRGMTPLLDDVTYPETLEESMKINETAAHRMIGLTIETRPEYVTDESCRFWRRLGVTRLEMGVQSTDDEVLMANKRGHDTECSRQAVHMLRRYGFKMSVHLMPGLYTSTLEKDYKTFVDVYEDPFFKPDEIKFYPTSVIPNTELYDLYTEGKYAPLKNDDISTLVKKVFLNVIPSYTRIKRLIRDIPATEIVAGSNITNLAQLTHRDLRRHFESSPDAQTLYSRLYPHLTQDATLEQIISELDEQETKSRVVGAVDIKSYRNYVSLDTRSREIRHRTETMDGMPHVEHEEESVPQLSVRLYRTSAGRELLVSYEDSLGYLYGFARLLLPDVGILADFPGLGEGTAVIRELHVYGEMASIGVDGDDAQHKGLGKKLLEISEKIAKEKWFSRLTIIAGNGVREYYKKRGYALEGTYMLKNI